LELGGRVLVLDAAGAVYRFDPARHPADPPDTWQSAGTLVAQPHGDLVTPPSLVPAADGQSAYAFLCRPGVGGEVRLVVRRVSAEGQAEEMVVRLPAPPVGSPALGPGAAVLALANGQLCRVPLDFDAPARDLGPTWRALGARPDSRGHVLHWRGDEYLVSDGGRRLLVLRWTGGTEYKLDTERPLELARAPAGAPVRLPGAAPLAAAADAGGTVTLIGGDVPMARRTWQLSGAVTAGPWAVGDRLAMVVGRHTLALLDPNQDKPAWTAKVDGDGIESPPRVVGERLVVADLSGRYMALDGATGRPIGAGYRHPAEVAPAASPVPFGPGRLFAPVTDGTVLLLPLADLDRPAGR
jgi:hypothetical protein